MSDSTVGQIISSGIGHLSSYSKHLYDSVRSIDGTYVASITEHSKNLYNSVKAMDTTHIKNLAAQSKQLCESAKAIDNSSLNQLAKYSKGVYESIKTVENANQLILASSTSFTVGYLFGARDLNETQKELERVKEERDRYKELAETGPIRRWLKSKL